MKNYNSSRKSLPCKICSEIVENVGNETTAVTCYRCVMDSLRSLDNSNYSKEDKKEVELDD